MENKKGNGLVIFLIVLVLLLAVGGTLLLTGVIKSPFVKETTTEVTDKTTTTADSKTDNSKTEVKETRYYQYKTEAQTMDDSDERDRLKYYEIALNKDGTASIEYLNVLDLISKKGIYVENDKYIILALNGEHPECVEGNYQPMISDGCTETIILIKDGNTLKEEKGSIYHFKIDDENRVRTYKQVQKSDLVTDLKN